MKKVLFFGREKCPSSLRAYDHLINLGFMVEAVYSNDAINFEVNRLSTWSGDYIFCFRSKIILSKSLIDKAKIVAVNFHPGPPSYPGSGCINYALYEDAESYGVTAHLLAEKVDSGSIISYKEFPIQPSDTVDSLLKRTHIELLQLFKEVTTEILKYNAEYIEKCLFNLRDLKWSGIKRKISELDKLSIIDIGCSEAEIKKIIRATYTKNYPPKIFIHGYEFILKVKN
jgi:methionyl-tRNA formyltransferase